MLFRLLSLACLAVALTPAQQPLIIPLQGASPPPTGQNPNARRYTVTGTVVNANTGAPVGRALVRVMGTEPSQTFTSDDGHFELKDVPEGRASLSAQRPGFQISGGRPGTQSSITVGPSTGSVQLKLMPESSVHGRVLNNEGEPIEGLRIQLFSRQALNGVSSWLPGMMATTDESGSFSLDSLQPGAYILHTDAHQIFNAGAAIVIDGRHFPDLYPPQYYPNAPDRNSAQIIQLQPGADAQVDISLTAVPSYSVSGTLTNVPFASGTCVNAEGEIISRSFRLDQRGQFTISGLPAGSCTLQIMSFGRGGVENQYGEVPINIASADLTGIGIAGQPIAEIPVTITGAPAVTDTPPAPSSGPAPPRSSGQSVHVQLIPVTFSNYHPPPQTSQTENGMVIKSVMPGTYRLFVQANGSTCVVSASSGGTDLLRSFLTVNAGGSAAPINITVRSDCGSLKATLDNSTAGEPVAAVVLPDGAPLTGRLMMLNGNGMTLGGLTPGDYTVYASTPDLMNVPYTEPDALKGYSGQKVTIGPNATAELQLHPSATPGEGR